MKLIEGAVPSDNGVVSGQREETVPAGTFATQRDIKETNIDRGDIYGTGSAETQLLGNLANVAENLIKLQ